MNIIAILIILCNIESSGNTRAIGDNGKAVGILQIHPVMVEEINRICELKGSTRRYTTRDRLSRSKSLEMAAIFLCHQSRRYEKRHGNKPSWQRLACSWNSGNIFKSMPRAYAAKLNRYK